jgi:CBS domain-containing protein
MKDLTAKDVMRREVLTVLPELTVQELSAFLVENQISGAPVADARGHFVGLASLTDIAESGVLADELLVRDIMTPAVFAVSEDTPLREVAQTMIAGRIHRLLVKRGHGIVGIVTNLDLLTQLVAEPPAEPLPRSRRRGTPAALGMLLAALVAGGCSRSASVDAAPPEPLARITSPSPGLPPDHPPIVTEAGRVRGTVTLAPPLRAKAPAGAVLFLIARTGKDRQIAAVTKADGATFPHAFELSSGDAMMPGTSFDGALEITARLSRTGDAAPAPGDLEGHVAGVAPGARDVRVELDTERP